MAVLLLCFLFTEATSQPVCSTTTTTIIQRKSSQALTAKKASTFLLRRIFFCLIKLSRRKALKRKKEKWMTQVMRKSRFICNLRVTRLGDLSPFGRLFKALGDNLFGPNRPNFWRRFGRFFKVDQNLKFLCYKIIIIAVNFQNKIFFKVF